MTSRGTRHGAECGQARSRRRLNLHLVLLVLSLPHGGGGGDGWTSDRGKTTAHNSHRALSAELRNYFRVSRTRPGSGRWARRELWFLVPRRMAGRRRRLPGSLG